MTDPIADMLTRIRNANAISKPSTQVPYSKLKEAIAVVLKQEGYITNYSTDTSGKFKILNIELRYVGKKPVINSIRRISSPGRRVYSPVKNLKQILAGMGITILSTSKGVMTNKKARSEKLGGEIICEVW